MAPAASADAVPVDGKRGGRAAGFAGGVEGTLSDIVRIIGIVAVAALVFWWLLFRQRRREDRELAAAGAAASGSGSSPEVAAAAAVPPVTPLPPMRELIPPVDASLLDDDGDRVQPRPDEANTPRWLRQSLREARFTDHRYREKGWADPLDD